MLISGCDAVQHIFVDPARNIGIQYFFADICRLALNTAVKAAPRSDGVFACVIDHPFILHRAAILPGIIRPVTRSGLSIYRIGTKA